MTGGLAVTWRTAKLDTKSLSNSEFTISTTTAGSLKEKYKGYSGFEIKMERKATVFIYTYFLPCSLMVLVTGSASLSRLTPSLEDLVSFSLSYS